MEPLEEKPTVDLVEFQRIQRESFDVLMRQRRWLKQDYAAQITALENRRDQELAYNLKLMRNLGISEDELPVPPMTSEEREATKMGVSRKLTHPQIKQGLLECMEHGQDYPSSFILFHLHISYQDLKEFVVANPDFISVKGKNKWTTYRMAGC